TGVYSETDLFNAGRNQYAGTFFYAVTAPIGQRLDANLRVNLTINDSNPDTRYHSGLETGFEYSLNYKLAPCLLAGINGYLHHQLTGDEVGGASVGGNGRKLHVFAYGPQLIYRGSSWGVSAKWQHEDNARNKAEGDKYWLQLFFTL
ncbi:MAG: transporter, partial [Gammaproteobacteria bacterium]|nr:transporter [Gammaproteobacteria bacterium]